MSLVYLGRLILLAAAVCMVALAAFGYLNRQYRIPGTRAYIALCLLAGLYFGAYAFELGQETVEGFFLATRIEYLGIAYVPVAWILLVLAFTNRSRQSGTAIMAGLLIGSSAIVAIVWTNNAHHLYYQEIGLSEIKGIGRFVPGDIYPLGPLAYMGAMVIGLLCLRGLDGPRPRVLAQRLVLILATTLPLAGSLAYSLGIRPGGLDLTAFTLGPGIAIFGVGLFRNRLLSLVPIAREQVIESMTDAVLVIDAQDRILDFNPAARLMFPRLGDKVIGMVCHDAGSPCPELGDALLRGNQASGDFNQKTRSGEKWLQYCRSPITDKRGRLQGNTIVIKDKTEHYRLQQQVIELGTHDPLTGLVNRQRFGEIAIAEIKRALRFGHRLCLMVYGIDGFRRLNEEVGGSGADTLLKEAARRSASGIRSMDVLARSGSAEFTILLPDTDTDTAKNCADKLLDALRGQPVKVNGRLIELEASVGLAELQAVCLPRGMADSPDPQAALDQLARLATAAWKRAKAAGAGRSFIHGLD